MSIEQQIASLTTATTDLLSAVNVKKATLDSSVLDAQNYALSASADKDQTAEDRVQTGLDRIATGEDRLATGTDRVQTSADRVQTGLDAQATAADRIKTTADAAATAADRAQTSLDAATSTTAADTATGAAAAALTSANDAALSEAAAAASAADADTAKIASEAARDASIVAQNNAVAVVTGGTATLTPQAGKIPLADANAKIAEGWLTSTALVEQTDIGTAPNEIPLNQYLGSLAYMNHDNVVIEGGKIGGVAVQDIARTVLTGEELDTINSSAGLVLRGGGKNLLPYSEQFDNAVWTKIRSSVTPNAVIAPNGTLTADKLVEDTRYDVRYVHGPSVSITAATACTGSIYIKQSDLNRQAHIFLANENASSGIRVGVDLTNGAVIFATVGGASNASAKITPVGNDWYYVSVTGIIDSSSTTSRLYIYPTDKVTTGVPSYTGDGTSGIYIWGAQLVEGTEPGPYVKTEADTITAANSPAFVDAPNGLSLPAKAGTTPLRRGDITFDLASDTSLIVRVKGSDGTIRSTTLTLA